jgi:ABC-2 type transport system permease protein
MSQNTMKAPEKDRPEQAQKATAVGSSGAASQHNLRNIGLIIEREYKNRVTQRSFIISSIILLVIVFIATFTPTIIQFINSRSTSQTSIALVNNAGTVAGLNTTALTGYVGTILNGATGTSANSKPLFALTAAVSNDIPGLQNQVKNGKLNILLILDRTPNHTLHFTYFTHASSTSDSNLSKIEALASQLTFLDTAHRLGLTPAQTRGLFAPPDLTITRTQSTRPTNEIAAGYVLAFAGAILIYISVSIYASIVAMGVAEEKSSRVMELLVNAATPLQLLVGKVVGIGAACLTQMVCLVVVGISAALLQTPIQTGLLGTNAGGFTQYLTSVSIPFYFLFLVYFLLAFFLYATLYAGLGALVKRQDEVQSAVQVPTMLIVIGWILVYLAVAFPDATWTKVLSYFPFWTPMLMLVRIGLGTVAWWEIVVTMAWMLIAISACSWFAARLYRMGVLMYGQRPGLGQMMKLAFSR